MERFLRLFSAYQDALSRAQRAEESELQWKEMYRESQDRLERFQQDSIQRERQLTDRHLGIQEKKAHVQDLMAKEFTEKQAEMKESASTIKDWQRRTAEETFEKLKKLRSKTG